MSRSVSTHPYSIATVYLKSPECDEHEDLCVEFWMDLVEDLQDILTGASQVDSGLRVNGKPFTGFEGYEPCDRWTGREDHVILEGELSEISVSEYCGIVAVCLAPLDPDIVTHVNACAAAAPYFFALLQKAFPDSFLRKVGTFSNGESVYETLQAI